MKNRFNIVAATVLVIFSTASNAHYHYYRYQQPMNNEALGGMAGGLVGALLGSTIGQGNGKVLAMVAGTIAGAYMGNSIGRNMDDTDRLRTRMALEKNALNEPAYWHNARTGVHYKVVPVRKIHYHGHPHCREFVTITDYDGHREVVRGIACRQKSGYWQVRS